MYYSGTVFRGDVVRGANEESLSGDLDERHQLFVLHALKISALHFLDDLILAVGAQDRVHSGLGHVVEPSVLLRLYVVDVRAYCQELVGGKGPRGGGPCHEVCVLLALLLERYVERSYLYHLVALSYLVRSKSCSAARAVRHYLVSFVDESGLEEFLDYPPAGLYVVVVQGDVRVVQIDQVAHAVGHVAPHGLVGEYGGLALFVELPDAVLFYVLLAGESQLLFDFYLHRQSVGVPACLAAHLKALHGLVPADGILKSPCYYVVYARLAVGRRGPFVEQEVRLSFPQVHALLEHVHLVPLVRLGELHLSNRFVR